MLTWRFGGDIVCMKIPAEGELYFGYVGGVLKLLPKDLILEGYIVRTGEAGHVFIRGMWKQAIDYGTQIGFFHKAEPFHGNGASIVERIQYLDATVG